MEDQASFWEILLTLTMVVVPLAGGIVAAVWAARRRERGEEASEYTGEGSAAFSSEPGPWG